MASVAIRLNLNPFSLPAPSVNIILLPLSALSGIWLNNALTSSWLKRSPSLGAMS